MSAEFAKRWFRRVMWLGIAANLALALPTMAAPSMMLDVARLPTATPEMWVRFSGLLLVLLSVFYMAPAVDPDRYRVAAWMSVGSRLAGVLFFMFEPEYRLFGLFDLVFFIPEALLLMSMSRAGMAAGRRVSVA
jgi:hypothetical protein